MNKRRILGIFLITALFMSACGAIDNSDSDLKLEFGAISNASVFQGGDTMSHWGGSIVRGNDGFYHMFYSRWKKELGWAWVTHSEIAHAISASPFGPFKHKDIALPARGSDYWDGLCSHNPSVHKFEGKYYLYYMGNTGDGENVCKPGDLKYNWLHRNNQRIGVAVADDPNGPWQRFEEPIIKTSTDTSALDALLVSNPSITQRPDGGYLMVYKAVGKKKEGIAGGPVVHCVASSESPIGPFKKYNFPVFVAEGHNFPAEDPFIWYQKGKYRAILKDMHGAFTDSGRALVYFESDDGFDWKLAEHPLASELQIKFKTGKTLKVDHLERPQIYLEDGQPVVIVCAADTIDSEGVIHSWNVQIPLIEKE